MDTRIFGLRNEYSVVFSAGGQRQLSAEEAGRRLFGPVASEGQATGVLLRNGGRLHLEAASRPEYATPECGSVPDLVVHDKAGERILEGLLEDAGQRLREEGDAGGISVLKASAGPAGRPYGCQEDYLVARRGEFGRLADTLIPFLVTRQLICGAGTVAQTPRGAVYCLSRPAGPTGTGLSSVATRSRPLINTRDEPPQLADRQQRPAVLHATSLLPPPTGEATPRRTGPRGRTPRTRPLEAGGGTPANEFSHQPGPAQPPPDEVGICGSPLPAE